VTEATPRRARVSPAHHAPPRWSIVAAAAIVALTGVGAEISLQGAAPDGERSTRPHAFFDPEALFDRSNGWRPLATSGGMVLDVRVVPVAPLSADT